MSTLTAWLSFRATWVAGPLMPLCMAGDIGVERREIECDDVDEHDLIGAGRRQRDRAMGPLWSGSGDHSPRAVTRVSRAA